MTWTFVRTIIAQGPAGGHGTSSGNKINSDLCLGRLHLHAKSSTCTGTSPHCRRSPDDPQYNLVGETHTPDNQSELTDFGTGNNYEKSTYLCYEPLKCRQVVRACAGLIRSCSETFGVADSRCLILTRPIRLRSQIRNLRTMIH